jgi:hypothetical protein
MNELIETLVEYLKGQKYTEAEIGKVVSELTPEDVEAIPALVSA